MKGSYYAYHKHKPGQSEEKSAYVITQSVIPAEEIVFLKPDFADTRIKSLPCEKTKPVITCGVNNKIYKAKPILRTYSLTKNIETPNVQNLNKASDPTMMLSGSNGMAYGFFTSGLILIYLGIFIAAFSGASEVVFIAGVIISVLGAIIFSLGIYSMLGSYILNRF